MYMKTCGLSGCERQHYAKGYCNPHWRRWKRDGHPGPLAIVGRGRTGCAFPNCIEDYSARGYCATHYAQHRRGKTLTPIAYHNGPQPSRVHVLKRRYGLTVDEYEKMLADQGGGCKICGGTNASGRHLHIDHRHGCCGKNQACKKCIRALLCSRCNTGIGQFRESPELLARAIAYLAQ
jgi:hypothetical protein